MTVEELQSLGLLITSCALFIVFVVLGWHAKFHKKPNHERYVVDVLGDIVDFCNKVFVKSK